MNILNLSPTLSASDTTYQPPPVTPLFTPETNIEEKACQTIHTPPYYNVKRPPTTDPSTESLAVHFNNALNISIFTGRPALITSDLRQQDPSSTPCPSQSRALGQIAIDCSQKQFGLTPEDFPKFLKIAQENPFSIHFFKERPWVDREVFRDYACAFTDADFRAIIKKIPEDQTLDLIVLLTLDNKGSFVNPNKQILNRLSRLAVDTTAPEYLRETIGRLLYRIQMELNSTPPIKNFWKNFFTIMDLEAKNRFISYGVKVGLRSTRPLYSFEGKSPTLILKRLEIDPTSIAANLKDENSRNQVIENLKSYEKIVLHFLKPFWYHGDLFHRFLPSVKEVYDPIDLPKSLFVVKHSATLLGLETTKMALQTAFDFLEKTRHALESYKPHRPNAWHTFVSELNSEVSEWVAKHSN